MIHERPLSRFATLEDVQTEEFADIISQLDHITVEYQLPDHSDVNRERYPWSEGALSQPAFYAARMWEYPFALKSAALEPNMTCVDVGCGMTAFTVYLKEVACCRPVGVDPDIFDRGMKYKGHGVSRAFARKTGIDVVQGSMAAIPLTANSCDRVFCLSVIEHLPRELGIRGVQEMARILRPGGRLILTVDVNLRSDISRPLDLLWESGLLPVGVPDFRWPEQRFGIFYNGKEPADVYGMTLVKSDCRVALDYAGPLGGHSELVPHHAASPLRQPSVPLAAWRTPDRPLWRRGVDRLTRAGRVLLRGDWRD